MIQSSVLHNKQEILFEPAAAVSSEQLRMVEQCIKQGGDLAEELSSRNLSLDDLEYEIKVRPAQGDYASLDRFQKPANGIPFVSFFAGCGGMDLGFEAAGFSHRAGIEINPTFAETIRKNRPAWKVLAPPFHSGDVSDLNEIARALHEQTGISSPFEGVFIGGPPCQPFSIAANQRFSRSGGDFKRTGFLHEKGNLLFSYVDLIELFRPKAFVIENVLGLMDLDGGEQITKTIQRLRSLGYKIADPVTVNAADFNVPQNRLRLFVVGTRGHRPFSAPTKACTPSLVGPALQFGSRKLYNHQPREHKAESILRYMQLKVGQRDQLGRVDRLDPRKPSKTIIAGGSGGGGRSHLHPHIPRTLTVRECARIQTFPDSYEFTGPIARQFTQVGNAVPPVLAAQIASAIAVIL